MIHARKPLADARGVSLPAPPSPALAELLGLSPRATRPAPAPAPVNVPQTLHPGAVAALDLLRQHRLLDRAGLRARAGLGDDDVERVFSALLALSRCGLARRDQQGPRGAVCYAITPAGDDWAPRDSSQRVAEVTDADFLAAVAALHREQLHPARHSMLPGTRGKPASATSVSAHLGLGINPPTGLRDAVRDRLRALAAKGRLIELARDRADGVKYYFYPAGIR
jgi:hypothetical protein